MHVVAHGAVLDKGPLDGAGGPVPVARDLGPEFRSGILVAGVADPLDGGDRRHRRIIERADETMVGERRAGGRVDVRRGCRVAFHAVLFRPRVPRGVIRCARQAVTGDVRAVGGTGGCLVAHHLRGGHRDVAGAGQRAHDRRRAVVAVLAVALLHGIRARVGQPVAAGERPLVLRLGRGARRGRCRSSSRSRRCGCSRW